MQQQQLSSYCLPASYCWRDMYAKWVVSRYFSSSPSPPPRCWLRHPATTARLLQSSTSILYSDGSLVNGVPPADTNLWDRRLATYGLHPIYDSVRVPETLIAHLRPSITAVRVLVSKPHDALLLPDGSPTNSDGVALEMLAKGQDGQILARRLATITQEEFLEHRWITLELSAPTAISEIAIKVLPGPPGSTPTYDSTLAAIQRVGGASTLFVAGKVVLSGLAAFVLALSGARILVLLLTASVNLRRWHFPMRLTWSPLIFGACLLAIVYWSASHTSYIYYWDLSQLLGKNRAAL